MAAGESSEEPLKSGCVITVTVEEALPTVITVCFRYGSKIYKGALMDSSFIVGPHGVNTSRERIEAANQPLKPPEVLILDPNHEPGSKPEISSLPLRHTYQLDPNAVDLKLLPPPPKKDCNRPIKDRKTVRAMRLRPRKVLCSNCKQGIHENRVKGLTTRSKAAEAAQESGSKRKLDQENDPSPLKKPRKLDKSDIASKTVPILKISISATKGGPVVKYPVQDKKLENQNGSTPGSPNAAMTHQQYRKMRKALKKAKLKQKLLKSSGEHSTESSGGESIHHKRNKHSKKMKRKHRYKDIDDTSSNNSREKLFDMLGPRHSHLNPSSQNGYGLDSPDKYSISNADEFTTIKKSIVRLEKLNIEESGHKNISSSHQTIDGKSPSEFNNFHNAFFDSFEPSGQQSEENIQNLYQPINSNKPLSPISMSSVTDTNTPQPSGVGTYQVQVSDISDAEDDSPQSVNSHPSMSAPPSTSPHNAYQPQSPYGYSGPPTASQNPLQPLMMRIHTKNVMKCELADGRIMSCGDIVWGKIHGFPWWPGRIISITQSLKDIDIVLATMANVAWFGSSTMSYMDCLDLFPYLEYYKVRYNKKKKGPYKVAIKQATKAAKALLQGDAILEAERLLEADSESYDGYDSLPDMEDIQSLDKENVKSLEGLPPGLLEYDIKRLHEESINNTPSQTPSHGKVETLDNDLEQQINNVDSMDSFPRQLSDDLMEA